MARPEIGVSMLHCLSEPFVKMTVEIPRTKTRYIEIVDDGLHTLNKRRVSALKGIAETHGIKYTVHAPFAGINISHPSKPMLTATLKRLKQSIINASTLECQLWIFHPGMKTGISMFYPGEDWLRNIKQIRPLVAFARDHGVEAAVENVIEPFVMKTVDDFRRFYDEIGEDVGLVLDTGHAHINGQLSAFMAELQDRIVHIHAHDNNGKIDQHLGIGHGSIDWKMMANQLRKTPYHRTVMVESVEHVNESMQMLKRLLI